MPHSAQPATGRHRRPADPSAPAAGPIRRDQRGRSRPATRTSRARTTGIATVVVSTIGIAMANTTGLAHAEPAQTGPKTTVDPSLALSTTSVQAAVVAQPPAHLTGTTQPASIPTSAEKRQHDEALAQLSRMLEVRRAAAEQAAQAKLRLLLTWVRPDSGRLTQPYGSHPGIDLGGAYGSNILAAHYGTVIYAGWESGYGNFIQIQHDNGIVTCYGHLSQIDVSVGQEVATGQVIGLEGSTGESTGPHLHFEVRVGGQNGHTIDPQAWLAQHGVII